MGPLDALWHLANFFAPALFVGATAAAVAKLVWRRELAAVGWTRLALWAAAAGAAVLVGGLVGFGRDGKMATYGLMVGACALALWWSGFVRRR
ncbi:hypothetical protein MOJ79_11565 [Calidifontimicrobium sp. SYSU G02091]|uniref:hypothetical protein n=1 Tax=Calidifontimicrobium sp. SYSU G02091 TaxID=2926421 RepID=UPI001F535794|nr:hypothetical protein [Calidifontimicrobium sp. SYSU G02091]MCI1192481.1 hypothetical protein [Calidifontimicrobium sp. SYSU G02091]